MIRPKNLLCVKRKENLELSERLLYEPYKNIIINFKELCVNISAKSFDPVSQIYDGLLSIPKNLKEYYEALLGVTSFYQHSQGGKGKYIEKKLASSFKTASLDIRLSELPLWLEKTDLHKKRAIFTMKELDDEEKRELRLISWDWLGKKDVVVDVGSIHWGERTIVLCELKNRIDSGGTAARREVWTSEKFGVFANHILTNSKLYRLNNREFSFVEFLMHFNIKTIEIYFGILFDIGNNPATIESDKERGFYLTSKEGLIFLKRLFEKNHLITIQKFDENSLLLEVEPNSYDFRIIFAGIYGNQIPLKLFREELPISDLLLLLYDDIWFSQLLAIDERMVLLKYGKNFSSQFLMIFKEDFYLRKIFDKLVDSECSADKLKDIVDYLLNKYDTLFEEQYIPKKGKTREEHLADVIQLICGSES